MELSHERRTRRPLVVWIDDQITLFLELVGHLNLRGFDVQPTSSITQFLQALQGQRVNVAIIDIRLGALEDGRTLVDLVYESRPEIGIIVHSSFPEAFIGSRYDANRVRFVPKGTVEPVEAEDQWPLAETLADLVNSLNSRVAGGKLPGMSGSSGRQPLANWATVQRFREFAMEHFVLAIVVALLLLKVLVLSKPVQLSPEVLLDYLVEVGGFVLPFVVAIVLAAWFTPKRLKEAGSADKFVQIHFEEMAADGEVSTEAKQELTRSGLTVPTDDFSVLVEYYNLLVARHLWLARSVLAVFAGGVAYLAYDIVHDLVHVFMDEA